MCGIFGIIHHKSFSIPSRNALMASVKLLRHRGPDADGIYSAEGIGLAHTRLSLLDLNTRSNQPFWDETGRYCLVYNGEIYNFRELRAELEARNISFQTTSDTEVLLQCLIHNKPESILPRFAGMFAFGFYDKVEGTVLLARDRFGMKPLYVYQDSEIFMFASEVKAMRPWITFEPDHFSISSYLLGFGGPTKGFTFYKNIKSVTPGCMVVLHRNKSARFVSFFSIPDFWDCNSINTLREFKPKQMIDTMEELMFESVKRHMFADAPVGAYCSGGVDSSLIMAMAAKLHNNLAIFHANIRGRWSEYDAALQLSQHLKLDLKVVNVADQDFLDLLTDVMKHYEHPFTYHPNCAPFLMVSRLAQEHKIKGMLSGEGSDECFLGYPWLGRERLVHAYDRVISKIGSVINKIPEVGKIIWPITGNRKEVVRQLLNRCEVAEDEKAAREKAEILIHGKIPPGNLKTVYYLNYHLRTLLHRNDCQGMAASIESRFPFLDHDLVKTAVNMPYKYKLRLSPMVFEKAHPWIRDKWVIRKVAERYIPRKLSHRVKIGFWTTVFERMKVSSRYFENSFVCELFELTADQMADVFHHADHDLVMRLLHLDVWLHVCLYGKPQENIIKKLKQNVTITPE